MSEDEQLDELLERLRQAVEKAPGLQLTKTEEREVDAALLERLTGAGHLGTFGGRPSFSPTGPTWDLPPSFRALMDLNVTFEVRASNRSIWKLRAPASVAWSCEDLSAALNDHRDGRRRQGASGAFPVRQLADSMVEERVASRAARPWTFRLRASV